MSARRGLTDVIFDRKNTEHRKDESSVGKGDGFTLRCPAHLMGKRGHVSQTTRLVTCSNSSSSIVMSCDSADTSKLLHCYSRQTRHFQHQDSILHSTYGIVHDDRRSRDS